MLDVTKEEPEVMDTECEAARSSDRPPTGGKPYLKFGVSAILGLDTVGHPSPQDDGSFRSPEDSSPSKLLDIKPELFGQHHLHSPVTGMVMDTGDAKSFHPVYLHSYFHPLIQHAHSTGKHFSGERNIYILAWS